jgi:hypothetical protein
MMNGTEVLDDVDQEQPVVKPKRETRPPIPAEVLETIYEEWVSYPDHRQRVPLKEHESLARQKGWFYSGWRGITEEMTPLPADLWLRLNEREAA